MTSLIDCIFLLFQISSRTRLVTFRRGCTRGRVGVRDGFLAISPPSADLRATACSRRLVAKPGRIGGPETRACSRVLAESGLAAARRGTAQVGRYGHGMPAGCKISFVQFERTLAGSVSCEGAGLHSGKTCRMTLTPASEGTGRVFVRTDLGGCELAATLGNLGPADHATCLVGPGIRISTVEHLLAALYALGVDNARIEIDAEEVPILDGSAAPFVRLIKDAGILEQAAPRRYITIARPLTLSEDAKQISVHPCSEFRVTYAIDFEHPALGYQELTADLWGTNAFVEKLAPARTFVLERDVAALKRAGLARGGTLENAIVIGDQGVLGSSLRFGDEPVRHKMLDLTGDLALLGHPLKGHVIAYRAGHDMHTALAQLIAHRSDAWYLAEWGEKAPAPSEGIPEPRQSSNR